MKPNELQIGDWVYYKGKEQMPCRVISIGGNSIKFDNGTPQDWMSDAKNFTPIPLTAEILEKNGFAKMSNSPCVVSYMWSTGGVAEFADVTLQVGQDHADKWRWDCLTLKIHLYKGDITLHKIRHVHELQRVLRICSINKEITL